MSWAAWVDGQLDEVRAAGRWRATRCFDALGPAGHLPTAGAPVTSFAGNDYLGLSAHPEVIEAAAEALRRWGSGATASRLVVGTRPVHDDLEAELAGWRGTEAALVLSSGYAANLAVLATLAGPGAVVLSDQRNHASIVDGCRLARSPVRVYRHGDLGHLEDLLVETRRGDPAARALVVTDTVFSMDGDAAAVEDLVALTDRHGAALVLDEAHAVLGPHPAPAGHVVRVGTLSKALGAVGGFVAGTRAVVDLLTNRARPFIFSTGLAPADAAAALAALRIVRSEPGAELRATLRQRTDRVRPGHPSPIVPVILGPEAAALDAADALLQRGLLVPAIRPPTVAAGTSRLRVALSAAHTEEDVERLVAALDELGLRR